MYPIQQSCPAPFSPVSGFCRALLGTADQIPVAADFSGDSRMDVAVWNPHTGVWSMRTSLGTCPPGMGISNGVCTAQFGEPGDVPLPADFDGDGLKDRAVWRPSNGLWYVRPSSGSCPWGATYGTKGRACAETAAFGANGDFPVAADFDGDGLDDRAVWRPTDTTWRIIPSSGICPPGTTPALPSGVCSRNFGRSTDIPVAADFDGDGRADIATWRPRDGTWRLQPSSNTCPPNMALQSGLCSLQWGLNGDVPAVHDYDGDGRVDPAVWRPRLASWYLRPSSGVCPSNMAPHSGGCELQRGQDGDISARPNSRGFAP